MMTLLLIVGNAWGQLTIESSTTDPLEGVPEHLYYMKNGNNLYVSKTTAPTQTESNYAKVAFYAVSGVSNAYHIYDYASKKWLSYNKATSYSNCQDFVKLVDSKASANYFKLDNYSGNNYQISPYTSTGSTDKYLNWYKGQDFNPLNGSNTLGLWQDSGSADAGSRWNFYTPEYPHNTGSINRDDRGLTSFTITDGENNLTVSSIQTSSTSPVYVDKTSSKLTTKQGATLKFTDFNYTGAWMHAYAYIDYNKDFDFELVNNNNGEGEGEIVSYNYYNGNDITGTPANQGSAIGNTYGESKAMPAFTLPKDLPTGEYRVRIKIDWNNLDANNGANDIAGNGGCQCDFTIVVEEAVGNEIAWDALNNAVTEALALFDAVKIGTTVGSYSSSIDGYEAEFNDIMSYKSSITEETPSDEIDSKTARVREIIASFSLNMPKAGDYFRIKAIEEWNDDARYLGAQNSTANTSRAEFVAEAGNNTIFYFDGQYLVSYASGHYLVNNSSFLGYNGVQTNGTTVEFRTSNNTSKRHAYNISFTGDNNATRWLYTNTGNFTDAGSSCGTEGGYNFNLEPVTELPVTIGSAGASTLYAPNALTLPEEQGLQVYTAEQNGGYLTLTEVKGVIPANTGVILIGTASTTYNFAISDETSDPVGQLTGTVATKANPKDGTIYTLQKPGDALVMKKYNGDNLNGFKAYYKTDNSNVQTLRLSFGETTGIDGVVNAGGKLEIYDMSGRRVEKMTKGLYIVNGQKVLVK